MSVGHFDASCAQACSALEYSRSARFQFDQGRNLLMALGLRRGLRVLDYGCGTGELSYEIFKQIEGHDATLLRDSINPKPICGFLLGIDSDSSRISLAREYFRVSELNCLAASSGSVRDTSSCNTTSFEFLSIDGTISMRHCLSKYISSFDIVFMNHVIHWVANKEVRPACSFNLRIIGFQRVAANITCDSLGMFGNSFMVFCVVILNILQTVFHHCHRLLKPGGLLVIQSPQHDIRLLTKLVKLSLHNDRISKQITIKSAEKLLAMALQFGFHFPLRSVIDLSNIANCSGGEATCELLGSCADSCNEAISKILQRDIIPDSTAGSTESSSRSTCTSHLSSKRMTREDYVARQNRHSWCAPAAAVLLSGLHGDTDIAASATRCCVLLQYRHRFDVIDDLFAWMHGSTHGAFELGSVDPARLREFEHAFVHEFQQTMTADVFCMVLQT